jgi:ribosomal subunit interface protein
MQRPVEVVFRQMDRSTAMEERVGEKASALDRRFNRVQNFRVTIAPSQKTKAKSFEVRVDMTVPGEELLVSATNEDAYVAISDAFQTAHRRLDDWNEKHRNI